jgi:hypothetical protein
MMSPQPLILRSPIRLRQVVEPIVCFAISELYFHFLLVIGLCVAYCRVLALSITPPLVLTVKFLISIVKDWACCFNCSNEGATPGVDR